LRVNHARNKIMNKMISCFLSAGDAGDVNQTIRALRQSSVTGDIFVLNPGTLRDADFEDAVSFPGGSLAATGTLREIAAAAAGEYILLYTKALPLSPGPWALERMVQVARDTGAGLVYSDYYALKEGKLHPNPVIDYQEGSLRDDFNFGSLLLYETAALKAAVARMEQAFRFAALYDLRLKVSQNHPVVRIPEFLYTEVETDIRTSGEKQFDYVDPRNRAVQIEMEEACTLHLKAVGGWLKPDFRKADLSAGGFPCEASVVIPVRNRVLTIEDAVRSVLSQQAGFSFNLFVVDNHSTDGTTEILRRIAGEESRLVHILPERNDLGIGGCWTTAVMDPRCGKFAIQLDSDDIYIDDQVIRKIVECFYAEECAMVVGSYRMVNFRLEEIPPGVIDHREWTPDNGPNNALRINGLGAPRAFYTPLLREIRIPNTSYGEDYAVGIRLSRSYRIGRIYEPLYLCRRWDENSDAALDVVKMNSNNLYKDRLRTIELMARKRMNR